AAGPSLTVTFVATLVAGFGLMQSFRRRETARANLIYRAAIDTLPDPLNAKDLSGRFIAANPATAELMRAEGAARLIGRSDFDFYPKEVAAGFRAFEEVVLAAGEPATIEQKVTHLDGSSGWLATLKAPLRDGNGNVIGLVTRNNDISERKRLEATVA